MSALSLTAAVPHWQPRHCDPLFEVLPNGYIDSFVAEHMQSRLATTVKRFAWPTWLEARLEAGLVNNSVVRLTAMQTVDVKKLINKRVAAILAGKEAAARFASAMQSPNSLFDGETHDR